MRLNFAWVYQFNIIILRIDPISNMLALTWHYCFVVVDNVGSTIYFLHKIIPRLIPTPFSLWASSMISKWKRTPHAFRFEQVTHDTGFVTEKPRRATGVEPVIPGIQILRVSSSRHRGLAGDRQVNNSTSISLIFFCCCRVAWGKTPTLNFNGTYLVEWIIVLFGNMKEWSDSPSFPRITYHDFVMFLVMV